MTTLKIKKMRENAILPQRATPGSAGLDLCACIDAPLLLPARGHAVVPTGIAIELPEGTAGFVFARSGLGIKHGIALANGVGVIDSDYTGEVCVGLINQFDEPYQIQPGERIAQLAVLPILCPVIEAWIPLHKHSGERGALAPPADKPEKGHVPNPHHII